MSGLLRMLIEMQHRRLLCLASAEKIQDKILRETFFCRQHLVPEIGLQLLTPKSEIWNKKIEFQENFENELDFFPDPYWAFFWPGGQGVARYILDNPHLVMDKSVIDLGCGCGAGSIAAKISRAAKVVANDIDAVALDAATLNWNLNFKDQKFGNLETCQENLLESNQENTLNRPNPNIQIRDFDVLLIGDMFFDEKIGNSTLDLISRFLREDEEKNGFGW